MPGGIHPPLSVIASWPPPNYKDPSTRPNSLTPICAVLGFFSVLAVALRIWSRIRISHNAGIDDWVMVLAMIPAIGMAVSICLAAQLYGFNRHVWDIPVSQLATSRKIIFAIDLQYIWATALIKISILLFYNRLATGILSKRFIYFVRVLVGFVGAYAITFTFTLCFTTRPISAFWNQVDPFWEANHTYSSISESTLLLIATAVSITQDFLVAGTPTVLFWRLQIPVRQKFALGAIFLIGFFLCIAGVLRIVYIRRVFFESYDVPWETHTVLIWTAVETLVGAIVASAPALKVLFREYFYIFAYSYGSRGASMRYSTQRRSVASAGDYDARFDPVAQSAGTTKRISPPNRFSLPSMRKTHSGQAIAAVPSPSLSPPPASAAGLSPSPEAKRHSSVWTSYVLDEDAPTPPGYVRVNVGPDGEAVMPSLDKEAEGGGIEAPKATHQRVVQGRSPASSAKWLSTTSSSRDDTTASASLVNEALARRSEEDVEMGILNGETKGSSVGIAL